MKKTYMILILIFGLLMSACKNNDNTQENKTIDKAILYNIPLDEGLDYEDQENYDITVLVKLNLEQLCV